MIHQTTQKAKGTYKFPSSEPINFLKRNTFTLFLFFILFFSLSIPEQLEWLNFQDINPKKLWISLSLVLSLLTLAFFISIIFVLWISKKNKVQTAVSWSCLWRDSITLILPLSVLSLRGAILFGVGLLFFILPGIYFYFKYTVAFFCLIIEGWQDECSPIEKAERIISKYRSGLLVPLIFTGVETAGVSSVEWALKLSGVQLDIGLKVLAAVLQTSITIFYYVYMTLLMQLLLKKE
jgi:hypothetical protein